MITVFTVLLRLQRVPPATLQGPGLLPLILLALLLMYLQLALLLFLQFFAQLFNLAVRGSVTQSRGRRRRRST